MTAGEPAPGADKGAGVKPLGSSEHPAAEPSSSSKEGPAMKFEEEPNAAEAPSLPLALRRIHEKLEDPVELYKLI